MPWLHFLIEICEPFSRARTAQWALALHTIQQHETTQEASGLCDLWWIMWHVIFKDQANFNCKTSGMW